jgi:hypothetical protein
LAVPIRKFGERGITLVGLTLSVGAVVAVPLFAKTSSAKLDVALGLIAFVVGYTLTMDMALRFRLLSLEAVLLERLETVEAKRYGALPIQQLLAVPDIEDPVRDLIEAAAGARAKRMPFLANRTIDRIQRDSEQTLLISQGVFRCATQREEFRLIRQALEDSRTSMSAVAGLGLEAWRTSRFTDYFDVYLDFASIIRQTRIFLVTEEEAREPDMIRILELHRDAGVETYALDKDRIPDDKANPIVLFDDSLLLLHSKHVGNEIEVLFTDEPSRVLDAREDFEALLKRARNPLKGALVWPRP